MQQNENLDTGVDNAHTAIVDVRAAGGDDNPGRDDAVHHVPKTTPTTIPHSAAIRTGIRTIHIGNLLLDVVDNLSAC